MTYCHLAQFFAMQREALAEQSEWPKLRAVLEINEAVPHVYNHTGYTLTVYANGLPTWRKQVTEQGRPNPRGIADELMSKILAEAALTGFDNAARCRTSLNRCHPHERPDCLPDGPAKGELLPTHG